MAREYTLVCDACGKKQSARTQVLNGLGKREDGVKVEVDLCMSCWDKLVKEFNIQLVDKKSRREFEVIPYDQIPRT